MRHGLFHAPLVHPASLCLNPASQTSHKFTSAKLNAISDHICEVVRKQRRLILCCIGRLLVITLILGIFADLFASFRIKHTFILPAELVVVLGPFAFVALVH